jgi:diaminopimelate decarboxylase
VRENIRAFHSAFLDVDKYFTIKANGNLTILRIAAQEGIGDAHTAAALCASRRTFAFGATSRTRALLA